MRTDGPLSSTLNKLGRIHLFIFSSLSFCPKGAATYTQYKQESRRSSQDDVCVVGQGLRAVRGPQEPEELEQGTCGTLAGMGHQGVLPGRTKLITVRPVFPGTY